MTESRNDIARKASKNRRDNEGVEIRQLTELLPLPQDVKDRLDKESVVRLIIAFIRLRQYLNQDGVLSRRSITYPQNTSTTTTGSSRSQYLQGAQPLPLPPACSYPARPAVTPVGSHASSESGAPRAIAASDSHTQSGPLVSGSRQQCQDDVSAQEGHLMLEVLQGFLILVNKKGKVLFASPNIEEYLGIPQAWILERPIVEFIHPEDVKELARQFDLSAKRAAVFPQPSDSTQEQSNGYTYNTARDFYLRMRHYPNGAGSRKKAGNYVVVQWTGALRVVSGSSHASHSHSHSRPRCTGMVCVCRPLQSQSILHIPLGGNMFISRHDMRLTYTYCDPRVLFLIGYDPSYLIGRSAYVFHNPVDAHKCSECHSLLIKTGSGVSAYYRFLGRTGVWVWMQTKATIVSDTRGQPQYIVCNNYIISQKEAERSHQMELQQQGQGHSLQAVPGGDLTAKGAIDLQPLSQVTSPLSSTDSEQEPHDDTGYNSAVSSIGSASTSPCPLNPPGGGGGVVEGELSALSPRQQVGVGKDAEAKKVKLSADTSPLSPHQQFGVSTDSLNKSSKSLAQSSNPQQCGVALDPEKGVSKVLSFPEQGLSFHSTLSSAIYGEELPVPDIPVTVHGLTGAYSSTDTILEQMGSQPTSSLSDDQSDPFLCSGGQGQGRAEGSVSHVMEDMDILEDLLERIADCDDSHDSVFTTSPSSFSQGEASSFSSHSHSSTQSQKTFSTVTVSSQRNGAESKQQPSLFLMGSDSSQHPSLLRTLLDKEGKAITASPAAGQLWTKCVSDGSAVVTSSTPSVGKGKVCSLRVDSRGPQLGSVSGKQQRGGGQVAGRQVLMYNGKQVVVPREVDLTQDDSGEGSEGEEEEEEVDRDGGMDRENLPPTLPDDLLDFAMQYCDSLTDMETVLPEGMTGLEADDWTVDDFMSRETHIPTSSPKPEDVPLKLGTASERAADKQDSQKQCDPKHKDLFISGKALILPAGTQAQPVSVLSATGTQSQPVSKVGSTGTASEAAGGVSSPVIQSAIITSTLKDLKPGITISLQALPSGANLKGFVIEPVSKNKTATMLKCAGAPVSAGGGGAAVKCVRLVSPALSDHRYSSPHTRSPCAASPRAASPSTSIQPPSGKRMRTEWDKGAGGVKVTGGGPSLLHKVVHSFPSPKPPAQPTSPHVLHTPIMSPASGWSSPRKPGSVDSSPASQPTSPNPAPIPANGGGKPLTAMSELEKHLRGLVAPPDERQKEPDDILTPIEECSGSGSRPFLERLLTGEMSHERYRQIDYHLLYQERERRMSENGHSS